MLEIQLSAKALGSIPRPEKKSGVGGQKEQRLKTSRWRQGDRAEVRDWAEQSERASLRRCCEASLKSGAEATQALMDPSGAGTGHCAEKDECVDLGVCHRCETHGCSAHQLVAS